jgi:hypothetical protein
MPPRIRVPPDAELFRVEQIRRINLFDHVVSYSVMLLRASYTVTAALFSAFFRTSPALTLRYHNVLYDTSMVGGVKGRLAWKAESVKQVIHKHANYGAFCQKNAAVH